MKSVLLVLCGAAVLMVSAILLKASWLDVDSGTWLSTGAMSSARSGAASVLLRDGRVLVVGGNDQEGPTRSAELFAENGSFSPASPMTTPRSGHIAVVMQDDRVLVAGGMSTGGKATNTAEVYDPVANSWTNVTGGMLEARSGLTAAVLHDGRVLVAGGQNGTLTSSTIEIFDPSLGRFISAGMMSSPRTHHAMTVLADGRALIVAGENGSIPIGSTDMFDPVTGTVSRGPSLSVPRYGHSATTLLNGQVVIIGGNNGSAQPAQMNITPAELFDPTAATPAFTTLPANLKTPREGHLAFLLPNNNNVLIVGGTSASSALASVELFTPQESPQGVWGYAFGSTGTMSTARSNVTGAANQGTSPSSSSAQNGILLVAGGTDAHGKALKSAETYGFATVQTDKGDYQPGTTVTITGNGWQPGETVQIQLVESPLIDTHGPYVAVANADGSILNKSFRTDIHDADVEFTVTAVGSVSRAMSTFSDAANLTVSSSANDEVAGTGLSDAASGASGAVTLNTTNTPVSAFGKSTLSTPMTVAAGGSNTVAFATVWVDEGSGASGTTFNVTASYGGKAMTSAGATSYDYNYAPISAQVFYLVNPPTGTNTLLVTATASSGTIQEVAANLVAYNGVNQTTPVRPGTYQPLHSPDATTVGSFTATINSSTTDLTLGTVEATYTFATPASNQTVDGVASADFKIGSDHGTTGAASVTDTWSFTNPWAYFAYVGFSIDAAGSGTLPVLMYTANPASRPYGTVNPAFTGTVTGFQGSDTQANSTTGTLTFTSTATSSSNVGSSAINGSGLSSTKYTFTQAASNATALTITKATPTITANGGTYTYDGNPHPATAKAVGVDGVTVVNGSFTFTYTPPGNSTVPVNVGSYSVTASFTSSDPNYNNGTGSGSITITSGASGTVTLNTTNTPVSAFGKSTLSTPMTVAAGGSNTVAFATVWVDEGSGASGTTFNVTASYGGKAMTSAGATSYDYNYAPISAQVFYLVNPPTGTNTLLVTATASSGTIQEVAANLVAYNGVNQTTPVRPGTYQPLHSPDATTVGSFTATINSSTTDLTLGTVEATYTFATPASNQTVDGVASADFKIGSDHGTTGAASVTDTWSFTNPWAYFAYVGFSIDAAGSGTLPVLMYTANPASRPYGTVNPAFTGTVTGFQGSDTQANSTTGTLTFTSTATSSSNVGSSAINGSGLSSTKYTFTQAASNATALTITKATPTITANGGTYTYDGNPHPATAKAVGVDGVTVVNGSFTFTYTPPGNSTVPVNVGSYSVTASFTSSDPNYNNGTGSGSITITSGASGTVTLNTTNTPVSAFGKSTLSTPMTVAAGGSNTVAFATVWVDEGSGASGTTFNVTASYGGKAMTSAGATSYDYNYAPISAQVFYLVNPPTGTNTLLVTATASSGTIQEVAANLVAYNGVNQTTPVRPGTYQPLHSPDATTVGSFTATINSSTTDLTLGTVEATYTFATPASNQTVDGVASADFKIGSDHGTTGAASVTDTWSFTNPWAYFAYVGFSIESANGGNGGGGGNCAGGSGGSPGYYQYQLNDITNAASPAFPNITRTCDLIVAYGATQLDTASFTLPPSFSDSTSMTQCGAACSFTSPNSSMNTVLWTGFSPGGTSPTYKFNANVSGVTIGGIAFELTAVSTLDQISTTSYPSSTLTSITSPSITTTHNNEVVLCLASEANPIANGAHFIGVSNGWSIISFGNQLIAYMLAPTSGTQASCTVTRAAGTEDITIGVASLY